MQKIVRLNCSPLSELSFPTKLQWEVLEETLCLLEREPLLHTPLTPSLQTLFLHFPVPSGLHSPLL